MDHPGLDTRRDGDARGRREVMRPGTPWSRGVLATVVALASLAAGCSRKATLMQETHGDSTAVASTDSSAMLLRQVGQAWDDPAEDKSSAALTLRALREDLASRPAETWAPRAEQLLDSLGVGVETAASPPVLFVNLFVRSDPGRGSWPALYWTDGTRVRWQQVEGAGMRLVAASSRRDSAGSVAPSLAAALFSHPRGTRQEPLLYSWSLRSRSASWVVSQTLGADSLGGFGTAAFESAGDSVDLVARTFQIPRGFDECPTCPHALRDHRFRWRADGFQRIEDRDVPSTYVTFVRFVTALQADPAGAEAYAASAAVIDQARGFEWNRPKGNWRIAPGAEAGGSELTMFRGGQEAYRVSFEPRGNDWVIRDIQTASRSIE